MKITVVTAIVLILCGSLIGWLAYENLMWAVWGKQNSWFEYVGFVGCPIMIAAGLIAFKSLKVGSIAGLVGYLLMLFYLGPALVNTIHRIVVGNLEMHFPQIAFLGLIVIWPLVTLGMLSLNIKRISSTARSERRPHRSES